jgi:two-component system CheB/CheR fusion protein
MDSSPNYVVGIGGSEGGLKAYKALLEALPPKTGMAFAIIAHMNPNTENLLADILPLSTGMPVVRATDGLEIQADHVYVITPDTDLSFSGNALKVVSPRTMNAGRHRQVDHFLASLAEAVGPRAIGVILSGGDGDGTEGCKRIKAAGGVTFAQDLSAKIGSMPSSATASGCVDFILPPELIAQELMRISNGARQGDN